ncbi:VOC family protein [Streptomyces sp. H27-D2]|uniref:VOC family protein n=1 Tax=Streptomyces sp. H27-D2 TaxID=3046304 RepID=UPI002DBCEB04|nr:VOC family protein [Streptomyces sp. H27-D2]MEC4017512.1 VOC family protein [Streptomyces sp. H27-D2]
MLSTRYVPGAPLWLDLGSPDIDATGAFYSGLFGWEFQRGGPEVGGYSLFKLGEKTVAAVGPLTAEGAKPAWGTYFHTPDAEATAKSVEQAGGSVRFEPFDVMELGRMGGFADPAGIEFCVWQPGVNKGLDTVTEPGSLCWVELHTPDPDAALAFYRSVFDWAVETLDMTGMTYHMLSPSGGGQAESFGGIAPLFGEQGTFSAEPFWLPYFEVADCDATVARAKELGGTVRMPASDMPGIGRSAQLADAHGAVFSVITSSAG